MRSGVMRGRACAERAGEQLRRRSVIYERVLGFSSPRAHKAFQSSSQNVSGDGMMKSIELPAYRAFMFAVVPQIMYAPIGCGIQQAIEDAAALWEAIDAHVLKVAEDVEDPTLPGSRTWEDQIAIDDAYLHQPIEKNKKGA